jgi:hypothetical protein
VETVIAPENVSALDASAPARSLMSIRRHDPKRDGNEQAIVRALEGVGCRIQRLEAIDLLALRQSQLYLLEIKTPTSRRRLTPRQRRLLDEGWPISVVTSIDEALSAVGVTGHTGKDGE